MREKLIHKGFTLQELIIVFFIITTMLALVIGNFFRSQQQTSLHARVQSLISDMRGQQIKAMSGEVLSGGQQIPYGIHFESNRYTLYSGETYSSSDDNNLIINLERTFTFENILFPSSSLEFDPITGDMENFAEGQNEITIRDTSTNQTYTIKINKRGVVYELD